MTEQARFRPRRFVHSNMFVSETQRAMDFYREVVGLEECFQEEAIGAGFLGNGNTHHDVAVVQVSEESMLGREGQVIVPADFGRRPGLFHLAFEMETEAELVAGYERAVKREVPILFNVDHTISKSVYLPDPEQNVLEFTSDATKDWRATFRKHEGKLITGPWTPGENPPDAEANYPVNPPIQRVGASLVHSQRATHASLGCRDLEAQRTFYQDVGGLDEVVYSADAGLAVLKGTAAPYDLVLFQVRGDQKPGYYHTAFEVLASDFAADVERLEASGIAIEGRVAHPAKQSVLIRDQDGAGVEFFTALADAPGDLEPDALRNFWLLSA